MKKTRPLEGIRVLEIASMIFGPLAGQYLGDMGADVIKQMQLQSVPGLQPGSVRLLVNDSQIEDLIEHRLQAMANRLLNQPELWREQSAFFRQPLAQREGQVEDVAQRVTFDEPPEEDEHA